MRGSEHPEGWRVSVRRTSSTVHIRWGVPFEIFVANLFTASAIAVFVLSRPHGALTPLILLAPFQFAVCHYTAWHLTSIDPWWHSIWTTELIANTKRLWKTRRRYKSLVES